MDQNSPFIFFIEMVTGGVGGDSTDLQPVLGRLHFLIDLTSTEISRLYLKDQIVFIIGELERKRDDGVFDDLIEVIIDTIRTFIIDIDDLFFESESATASLSVPLIDVRWFGRLELHPLHFKALISRFEGLFNSHNDYRIQQEFPDHIYRELVSWPGVGG